MTDAEFMEITEAAAHLASAGGLSGDQLIPYDEVIRLCALARRGIETPYAVVLQSLLIEAREIVHVFNPFDPLKGRIDAALAKNPNPIGQLAAEASVCLATLEASRAGGAGTVSACHEIGTGCAHEWISADHPPQITGMIICRKCKEIRAAGHESDAPVPVLAVGTGTCWTAFADREPPWDPERGVQFAMMLVAKGGRVELDTAIHPNYAQACKFTHWRPLSEVVLSQVTLSGVREACGNCDDPARCQNRGRCQRSHAQCHPQEKP